MDNYLSTKEAATHLGVPRGTVLNWIYRRKLRGLKRGWCWYVLREEVEAMRAAMGAVA